MFNIHKFFFQVTKENDSPNFNAIITESVAQPTNCSIVDQKEYMSNIKKLNNIVNNETYKRNWIVRLTSPNGKGIYNLDYVLNLPNPKQYFNEKDICLIAAASPDCCEKIINSKIYQDSPIILNKLEGFIELDKRLSLQ